MKHHISYQMHLRDPDTPALKIFIVNLHLSQEWSWALEKNNHLRIFIPVNSWLLVVGLSYSWCSMAINDFNWDLFRLWKTDIWQWCLMVSSTWNLCILTIERYLEVVHPIWHKVNIGESRGNQENTLATAERKLKADRPHLHNYSTHRQTPWTDNDSSLLFAVLGKARNFFLTFDLEPTFLPWP